MLVTSKNDIISKFIIGLSGLEPNEYRESLMISSLSEVDLSLYLNWTPKQQNQLALRIRQGHQIIASAPSPWIIKQIRSNSSTIQEMIELLNIQNLIIRVYSQDIYNSIPYLHNVNTYLEFQKQHHTSKMLYAHSVDHGIVWDPAWLKSLKFNPNLFLFKIHGWHFERWIRKYSHNELLRISKKIRSCQNKSEKPIIILLSHSQRREQIEEFKSLFP